MGPMFWGWETWQFPVGRDGERNSQSSLGILCRVKWQLVLEHLMCAEPLLCSAGLN